MPQPDVYKDCWIQTFSGRAFPILKPHWTDIHIDDIAHALSNVCRFAGHTRKFFSVAQHSIIVSHNVPPAFALEGLLHDGTEAYCGDMSRPLKHSGRMDAYKEVEHAIWIAIAERYNLQRILPLCIKVADVRSLITEQRDLMGLQAKPWADKSKPYDFTIKPLSPRQAKTAFMKRFKELCAERHRYAYLQKAA